ncbi:MAG: hypothetical protein DSZ29_03950 [Aquificaceae bacterium]|nr:MAG: hypothetical protein DSZ29_03950 [Aquificaceae bacterium]
MTQVESLICEEFTEIVLSKVYALFTANDDRNNKVISKQSCVGRHNSVYGRLASLVTLGALFYAGYI